MSNARFQFQENNYYHVYNRWFQKQLLFRSRVDFQKFFDYVFRYIKEYENISLISYCFLPNHFHFILQSKETGLEISEFMRKVQVSYAMYFKRKFETGLNSRAPVFEWRFKAKLIDTDEYLAQCIAYVNYNPLKHEIVKEITEYPWTSYHQLENKNDIMWYKDIILSELEY